MMINSLLIITVLVSILFLIKIVDECEANNNTTFDNNYVITYGNDHFIQLNQGQEVQLTMDNTSGTGFVSKKGYGSGYFEMRIKTPQSQSPSIVTTFYLGNKCDESMSNCGHSELDFEFLSTEGPPYNLQTNVYSNDYGGREQQIHLWFDPSQDFHSYAILWNTHQIVIWEGTWASNGTGADWAKAPFQAHYQEFEINGCEYGTTDCSAANATFWWNKKQKWALNPRQQRSYDNVKAKYLYYDYCQEKGMLVLFVLLGLSCKGLLLVKSQKSDSNFDENYKVTWGFDHVLSLNQGTQIQLSMDKSSGAGFASKQSYSSGFINLRTKLPDRDSAGVVTAFYLSSDGDKHDELDFEFLGNREGKAVTLQTNVFANGQGNREQRTLLWFDPSNDFHTYSILWNPYQIVFFVDDTPIRVFKNNTKKGVNYPTKPMKIQVSLWNGEDWATDGGKTKTNWAYAPFKAHFQGFHVDGCSSVNSDCNSENKYFWNTKKYQSLDSNQIRAYEKVRKNYMNYDYCSDRSRYPTPPPECLDKP
ncbi:hypothetical protein G4B88_003690 [Cannabis sativa]|uniref:xyloglucan:xyloglucosyl transferase n=1 Tax=Cannabis sativa TaxID=3483 RepID=A0A7J6F9X8_CANSA|nr:hypothetical protein G4B88_003690 [Cannabis sativa]